MSRIAPSIDNLVSPEAGLLLDPHWWLIKDIQKLLESQSPPDTRGFAPHITENDSRMLRSAAVALKAARVSARSKDERQATAGRRQMVAILSYLTGFFDGKGVGRVNPGLLGIVLSAERPGTIDDQLDALQESLEGVSTRGPGLALAAVGALVCGIGYVVGKIEDSPK